MINNRIQLFKNVSWFGFLQLINYLFPLVVMPFLARQLGPHDAAIAFLGLTLSQLGTLVVEFGFGYTLAARIASSHDTKEMQSVIASSILAKLFIAAFCSVSFVTYAWLFSRSQTQFLYFISLCLPLLITSFASSWVLQGLERPRFIVISTFASKAIYVFLVLLLVKSSRDLVFISLALAVSGLVLAAMLTRSIRSLGYVPSGASFAGAMQLLRDALPYFISRVSVFAYSAGGTIVLGALNLPLQLAIYSPAEQLYRAAQSLISPISQAIYPYMDRTKDNDLIARILKYALSCSIVAVAIAVFNVDLILRIVFGAGFAASAEPLILMLLGLAFVVPSVMLGYPYLGVHGKADWVNGSVYAGVIAFAIVILCSFLSSRLNATVVASAVVFAEIVVLFVRVMGALRLRRVLDMGKSTNA